MAPELSQQGGCEGPGPPPGRRRRTERRSVGGVEETDEAPVGCGVFWEGEKKMMGLLCVWDVFDVFWWVVGLF